MRDLVIIWTAATVPLGVRGAFHGGMSEFQPRVFGSRRQKALPNCGGGEEKLHFFMKAFCLQLIKFTKNVRCEGVNG